MKSYFQFNSRKSAYSSYRSLYPAMSEASYKKMFEHFWSEYLKHRNVRRFDWDMRVQKNPGEDWHRDRIYNAQSLIRSVMMSNIDKSFFLGSIASDRRAAQESKFRGMPNPLPQAKEALARYKADLKAGHKSAAEYWRGQAAAYFTANPVYYHPAPLNTSTVYKEQFRNEWWVYSNGKKRWVTRRQAVDMLEKGAKFVMVRAYPWEASLVPTKHVLANPKQGEYHIKRDVDHRSGRKSFEVTKYSGPSAIPIGSYDSREKAVAKVKELLAEEYEDAMRNLKGLGLNPTKKNVLANPANSAGSTPIACQECGHRFLKKIGKGTIEVKCPKCGGYDTDIDYKARNPIGAIGTALVTGLGFGTGITMVDRMLKKGK